MMTDDRNRIVYGSVVPREQLWSMVQAELAQAYQKHGALPWGRHEFYAVMLEEVEEVWGVVKSDGLPDDLLHEVVQVVAMCVRYCETGNRYGDPL